MVYFRLFVAFYWLWFFCAGFSVWWGCFFFMFMLWVVYFCRSVRTQIPFISQSESTCLCFIITVYNYFFCHLASSLDLLGYNSLFFSHLVLPSLRDSKFIRGIIEKISGFVFEEESHVAGNVFVCFSLRVWVGPFLFATCFYFFLGGSQSTYWRCLLLLLLSFGVFTGRALAGGIIYLFILILFATCLIPTCFTGFPIAPYCFLQ